MAKRAAILVLGILIITGTGCAGSKSRSTSSAAPGPSAAVPPAANVSGMWTGQEVGGPTVSMMLKQTGEKVTGDLTIAGRPDISGPVEGRVQGNTLTLRERSGYGSEPLLNVKGDQITGTVAGTTLNLKRVR
jgi:hypothetical protein